MSGLSDVTLVTVSYNSADMLRGLLKTVPAGIPVVVVDNGSRDETGEAAMAAAASLTRLDSNQGFGRACNAGAAMAGTEFLFFVNPDARLEPSCIEALLDAARRRPAVAGLNPRIVNPSGRVEYKWRSVLLPRTAWTRRQVPETETELPALAGGALFCRRVAFERVGGFDPAIFLFHEDDDLAIRLQRDCGPLLFVPQAVVRHDAGKSSGQSPELARFKGYHLARSRVYAMAKHGRPRPWSRTMIAALGGLLAPHNLVSVRRRAKYLGQIAGAWSARHDGGAFT